MNFRRSFVSVGAVFILASCTSDPKEATSTETTAAVAETTAATPTKAVPDLSAAIDKNTAVLKALDGAPESAQGVRTGTGPCPLFDVTGATTDNAAGTWNFVVKPTRVSCKLSEGYVGVAIGDVFSQGVAEAKAVGDEAIREFPVVAFAKGSINSICTPRECSAVWTNGALSVFRSATERETALTWLQANLATVLERGAAIDPAKLQFEKARPKSAAGQDMVAVFQAQLSGDYDAYFSYLYPEQQKNIRKDVFVRCITQPLPASVPKITAVEESDQEVNLGVADNNAKVVTLQINDGKTTSTKVVYTLFSEGKWRWLLGTQELAAFAKGDCR
jgi:hypothetical protein